MSRNILNKQFYLFGTLLVMNIGISFATATEWKTLADNLIADYQGKIVSIEQLNSTTCWAVLASYISDNEAVELAENIGYYIRNVTGGAGGEKPSIHVFVDDKHVAIARPSGIQYIGKLSIENWNPSAFEGKYRP